MCAVLKWQKHKATALVIAMSFSSIVAELMIGMRADITDKGSLSAGVAVLLNAF